MKIVSLSTGRSLKSYLAFRHFFSHSYAFDLDSELLKPLIINAPKVFAAFEKSCSKLL